MKISAIGRREDVELEFVEGAVVRYSVREFTGALQDQYMKKMTAKAKVDKEGKVTEVIDPTGVISLMLSLCLYDDTGKLVPEVTIQSWPVSVQEALFEVAQNINGMKKEVTPEEGEPGKGD